MGRSRCVVSGTEGSLTSSLQFKWKTWDCQRLSDEKLVDVGHCWIRLRCAEAWCLTKGSLTSSVQLKGKTRHCQCVGDEKSGITIPLPSA